MPDKPTIEYGHAIPWTKRRPSPRELGALLAVAVIACLSVWIFGRWTQKQAQYAADKNNCSYAFRTIAQAMYAYSADYDGAYPPDLQALVTWRSSASQPRCGPIELVCPGSHDQAPSNAESIALPGHCSYIYVGAGLSPQDGWDRVVAIEDPANHDMRGGYVLLNTFTISTRFCDLPMLMQCFEDLEAGRNPPSTQTTLSWQAARRLYETKWKASMPQLKSGVWKIPQLPPSTQP